MIKKKTMKYNSTRKHKLGLLALLVLPLILLGCAFVINNIYIEQENEEGEMVAYVKAGEVATFKFDGYLEGMNGTNEAFIVAVLVPRSWNASRNAVVTYTEDKYEPEIEHPMTVIPNNESPASYPGMTWTAALKKVYGVRYNVLNDMEWIAFKSEPYADVSGTINFVVTFKCNAGTSNLRFKPAFFINHSTNGLGSDKERFAIADAECFEVVGGKGAVTDFCSVHYFQIEPINSLQDDFVTFTFQGDIYENDLKKFDKVYWEATAYTIEGNKYKIDEKSEKTLMKKDKKLPRHSLTIWPGGFFNIPEGETITRIEYFFTNEDGTVYISKTKDDRDNSGEEVEEGSKEPFEFELQCE